MKSTLIVMFAALFLAGMSLAQAPDQTGGAAMPEASAGQSNSAAQAAAPESKTAGSQIAAGTTIPAELTKSLDAKKIKQGAKVEARTTQDLLSNGQIVIPRGSKIMGHVTDAQPRAKGENSSMIGLAFDQLVMKDGKAIPMNAGIQAIAKPVQSASTFNSGNEPMSESGGMPGGPGIGGSASVGGMGRAGAPQPGGYPNSNPNTNDTTAASSQGAGALSPGSSGVIGLKDLSLSQGAQGSVISSDSENVHLDSGTQLILKVK